MKKKAHYRNLFNNIYLNKNIYLIFIFIYKYKYKLLKMNNNNDGVEDGHIRHLLKSVRNISQENPGIRSKFASFDDHIIPNLGTQTFEHHNMSGGRYDHYANYGAPVVNRTNNRIRSGLNRFIDSA